MRNKTLGLAAALLVGTLAAPAFASVTVVVDINKDKDVTITENITIGKSIYINAVVERLDLTQAAEANAIANMENWHNLVDRTTTVADFSRSDFAATITRINEIDGSVNGNTGGIAVNQDTGDMVNQANLMAVGFNSDDQAVTDAQAAAEQQNYDNKVNLGFTPDDLGTNPGTLALSLLATINNSVNDNTGVVGVNQNGGNMNNQVNAVAAAIGFSSAGGAIALAEADLGQVNRNNSVSEYDAVKSAAITGSVNGNTGIVGVNQALGNNGNQGIVVAVGAAVLQ